VGEGTADLATRPPEKGGEERSCWGRKSSKERESSKSVPSQKKKKGAKQPRLPRMGDRVRMKIGKE